MYKFGIAAYCLATVEGSLPPAPSFWEAYAWTCGFVLAYDVLDRRLNTGSWRAVMSESFWFYTGAHMILAAAATWLLIGQIPDVRAAGLIAAVSTETVFSNADVRFGDRPLFPLAEWFRTLRAKNDATVVDQREAALLILRNKLSAWSLEDLKAEWTAYFLAKENVAAARAKIAQLERDAGTDKASLKAALATELVTSNAEYVKQRLRQKGTT